MSQVTVFRDKYRLSWPERSRPPSPHDRGEVVDLGDALERAYPTDAHFAAYASHNGHRLNSGTIARSPVTMTCVVFDVDCAEAHRSTRPAPEEWRVARRKRVLDADRAHPGVYGYDTKGGLRFLWRLPTPTLLATTADAFKWAQDYAISVAYLERCFGLHADSACGDWQRLFRLPRATRDVAVGCENRPIWGSPDSIGVLLVEATANDVRRAGELTRAFRQRRVRSLARFCGDGHGLFIHLLRQRGDIFGPGPDGSFVVRCPNEANHSTGYAGDSSTVVYPPAGGEHLGAIHCFHAHCQGLNASAWLRMFDDAELARAKAASGVPRGGRAA